MKIIIKILCAVCCVVVATIFFFEKSNMLVVDNAYVSGRIIKLTATVGGKLGKHQLNRGVRVEEGELLMEIDSTINGLNISELTEELQLLINRELETCMTSMVEQLKSDLRNYDLELHKKKLERIQQLAKSNVVSKERLEEARFNYIESEAHSRISNQETKIELFKNHFSIFDRPSIKLVLSRLKKAYFYQQQLAIRAPSDGYIYEYYAYPGQQVEAGEELAVFIPEGNVTVEANILESKLSDVHIGDQVTVTSYLFGRKNIFDGEVLSIVPSAVSAFSGIPRNIGDSNWVKVEQRVPVLIHIFDQQELVKQLPIGASVKVEFPNKQTNILRAAEPPLNLMPLKDNHEHSILKQIDQQAIEGAEKIDESLWLLKYKTQVDKIFSRSTDSIDDNAIAKCLL